MAVAEEDSRVWFFNKVLTREEVTTPEAVLVSANPLRIEVNTSFPGIGAGVSPPCKARAIEPTRGASFSSKDIDLKYAEPSLSIRGQPVRLAEMYAENAEVLPGRRSAIIISAPDRRKAGGLIVDGGRVTHIVEGTRVAQFYSIDGDLSDAPAYRLDGSAGCEAISVNFSCEGRIVILTASGAGSSDTADGPVLFWVLENPAYRPTTQVPSPPGGSS